MAPQTLILLDEPFEGLAPAVVTEVLVAVERLRERTSILLVEHKIATWCCTSERAYVIVTGRSERALPCRRYQSATTFARRRHLIFSFYLYPVTSELRRRN
jgi:branched-chain amino acid transport system ATP-binding protein